MAVVGFGLAIARRGHVNAKLITAIALQVSGAAVIVIADLRMRVVRRRTKEAALADDNSTLTDAFPVVLMLALFGMPGLFALQVALP